MNIDTQKLAEIFCRTKLPDGVCSDRCASMPEVAGRSGTNLLSVAEAKKMFDAVFAEIEKVETPVGDENIKQFNLILSSVKKDCQYIQEPYRTKIPSLIDSALFYIRPIINETVKPPPAVQDTKKLGGGE